MKTDVNMIKGCATDAQQNLPIPTELEILAKNIESLRESIDRLRLRLDIVSLHTECKSTDEKDSLEKINSSITMTIRGFSNRVITLNCSVRDQIEALEL
jgi:hypothetical protein